MDYANHKVESKYIGIQTAIKVLLMDDYLIQLICWFNFDCKEEYQFCLIHHLIRIANKKYSIDINYIWIEYIVIEYWKLLGEYDNESKINDPIEVLKVFLIYLHSAFVFKDCSKFDSTLEEECGGQCNLHRYFCLKVAEEHRCGDLAFEEPWENDTICQYFHMDYLFSDLDIGKSECLASHPPFIFDLAESPDKAENLSSILTVENIKIESNFDLYRNRLPNYIKKTLKIENGSDCFNEKCSNRPQNIKIKLENTPYFYMLQLESSQPSHLTSFLSTISLKPVINLSEIYDISTECLFSLTSIIFNLNNSHIFANFDTEYWKIEGYSHKNSLNFKDFLEIAVIMKLQPYIIVYCCRIKGNNEGSFELSRKDLCRLEQIAVQADFSCGEKGILADSFDKAYEILQGFKEEDEFNYIVWSIGKKDYEGGQDVNERTITEKMSAHSI